jgi:hypothetical protein
MRECDVPLVRGGKLTPEMLAWLEKVERVFPGTTKDLVIIRQPGTGLYRGNDETEEAPFNDTIPF